MKNENKAQPRDSLVNRHVSSLCPKCDNCCVMVPGDHDRNSKEKREDNNKLLTYKAEKHQKKWKFDCSQCRTIFCGKCKIVPYHLGYSCEEWEVYEKNLTEWIENKNEEELSTGIDMKEEKELESDSRHNNKNNNGISVKIVKIILMMYLLVVNVKKMLQCFDVLNVVNLCIVTIKKDMYLTLMRRI